MTGVADHLGGSLGACRQALTTVASPTPALSALAACIFAAYGEAIIAASAAVRVLGLFAMGVPWIYWTMALEKDGDPLRSMLALSPSASAALALCLTTFAAGVMLALGGYLIFLGVGLAVLALQAL